MMRAFVGSASMSLIFCAAMAQAAPQIVKIAFIDPLSGGAAATGEAGLKTYQYLAEHLNASQGDYKFEVTGYDNKVNPQDSLVAAQKAIDSGARNHPGQRLVCGGGANRFRDQIQRAQSRQGGRVSELRGRGSHPH